MSEAKSDSTVLLSPLRSITCIFCKDKGADTGRAELPEGWGWAYLPDEFSPTGIGSFYVCPKHPENMDFK